MKIVYTILEVERHKNANLLRTELSFLEELRTETCDARKEYPYCCDKYPKFKHIFDSVSNLGIVGLWISNLNAFYNLLNSDNDAILIFEDDAVLVDDFETKFKNCIQELPEDWGMFSIGYRDLYLSYYSEKHSIGKNNVCKMFQTGDSWGIMYRKEFIRDVLNVITTYKILGGLHDTAIMSYALEKVGHESVYKPYSTHPSLGSLVLHNDDPSVSTLSNSPIK